MKSRLLLLTAVMFAAVSCVNEMQMQIEITPGETITIRAGMETPSGLTKTLRDENSGNVMWAPGDRISLFWGSGSAGGSVFTSQNAENALVAEFTGSIDVTLGDKWFWGVYPYNASNECDGTGVTVTLPYLQTAVPGTFAPETFVSVGRSKGMEMPFYNVCGGIKFRVSKEGVRRVTFRSFDGPIAGKARIVFDGSGRPMVDEIIDGSEVVVLEAPEGQYFDTDKNYYLILLPHSFTTSFFSVTFETDTQIGTYERTRSFTVSRSVFETFSAALDSTVEWTDLRGRISTPAELQQFLTSDAASAKADDIWLISADIDMTGIAPAASAASFAGLLDGCFHTLSGISSSQPLIQDLSGTVRDLTLDSDCVFTPTAGDTFGALAGVCSGTLSNITTKASVTLTADSISKPTIVAGLAGRASGPISDCHNEGDVSATVTTSSVAVGVAGLVGYLEAGMTNCSNKGDISFSARNISGTCDVFDITDALPSAGGLVAYGGKNGFSMGDCENRGTIDYAENAADQSASANRTQIGGVVGSPTGAVTRCNNYGPVNASLKHSTPGTAITDFQHIVCIGGIGGGDYYFTSSSGTISNTNYRNCVNEGNITLDSDFNASNSTIGGIVGWPGQEKPTTTSATRCTNRGKITVRGAVKCRAGGIEGGTGAMYNCFNEGQIHVESCDATSSAGSLCGFHSQGHAIQGCTAAGSVVCDVQLDGGVGGLIGCIGNTANKIATNCTVDCSITTPDNPECTGMVVGKFNGTSYFIILGTCGSPIQVSGSINGTPASLENIRGSLNSDEKQLVHTNFGTGCIDTSPVPPTLSESIIHGTAILPESNTAGCITNASTGAGIPGIAVSDGYSFVVTDENGVYQMDRDPRSRKIYYTTPADYKISLNSDSHLPEFYSLGIMRAGDKYRVDFVLEPLDAPENEFTLFMIGDPQCSKVEEANRYVNETIADIRATASNYPNVYAITLGDIVFDSTDMWDTMVASMSNVQQVGGRYIPFFQTIGNHDHNSLEEDSGDAADNDYRAVRKFVQKFGPTDYSFDRGNAHIIVMDDIMVKYLDTSSKTNGYTWKYDGGFTADQYEWLQQDLANVADKADKIGFLCLHIPFRGGSNSGGSSINKNGAYYSEILGKMTDFKEFHIMIGHTHYQQNYLHSNYICGNGLCVYEHIHGAACGAWWSSDINLMGGPNGYTIYTLNDNTVTNWKMKGANHPENYQLRVYDGNQAYTGSYLNTHWYESKTNIRNVSGMNVKGFTQAKNSFVAEVFNDDKDLDNWWVEFWQNGVKVGDFTRRADTGIHNVPACAYFINYLGKKTTSWTHNNCSHYWYYTPASGDPSSETDWEVRVYHRIPNNPTQINVYTCNELTTDYSSFHN